MAAPKPRDIFLGALEVFGVLVPGALLALAALPALDAAGPVFGLPDHGSADGSVARWLAGALAAYVAGHMLHGLSGTLFDPVYDRLWLRYREPDHYAVARLLRTRRDPATGAAAAPLDEAGMRALLARLPDPQRRTLLARAWQADPGATLGDNFWFRCWSRLRMSAPAAADEIDRIQADSKMFRALALVLPALALRALWEERRCAPAAADGCAAELLRDPTGLRILVATLLAGAVLCLLRGFRHRRDATMRTYEYTIILNSLATQGSRAATL